MTSTANRFFDQLEQEIKKHPALNHPFLERIFEGEMTLQRARVFGTHYYRYSKDFYRFMAAIISRIPDEVTREPLLLNLFQGGGENNLDSSHPALFRKFLCALGVEESEIGTGDPLPEISVYMDCFWRLCRDGHFLEALGALGPGTEMVIPHIFKKIVAGLRKLPELSDNDLTFFDAHIELDIEHYAKAKEVLLFHASEEENQVLIKKGAFRILDARKIVWDGLERVCFGGKEAGEPLELTQTTLKGEETKAGQDESFSWTPEAVKRFDNVPAFVKPFVKKTIEKLAKEKGCKVIDDVLMEKAGESLWDGEK